MWRRGEYDLPDRGDETEVVWWEGWVPSPLGEVAKEGRVDFPLGEVAVWARRNRVLGFSCRGKGEGVSLGQRQGALERVSIACPDHFGKHQHFSSSIVTMAKR